jgi:hypothetical protein
MSDELVTGHLFDEVSELGTDVMTDGGERLSGVSCDCLDPFCVHWVQGRDSFCLVRLHETEGGVYERREYFLGELSERDDFSLRVYLFDRVRGERGVVLKALGRVAEGLPSLVRGSRARQVSSGMASESSCSEKGRVDKGGPFFCEFGCAKSFDRRYDLGRHYRTDVCRRSLESTEYLGTE